MGIPYAGICAGGAGQPASLPRPLSEAEGAGVGFEWRGRWRLGVWRKNRAHSCEAGELFRHKRGVSCGAWSR